MKTLFSLFTILLLSCAISSKAEKRRILFIGNSYTAVNDLPTTLYNLALSLGDTLIVDSYTPGGTTFNMHTTDANTLAKLQVGNWDYVVLQAQSQEPSFDPAQVMNDTYPYAAILDSMIHVYSPCAETIFYMTWGRKNGDAMNCAVYPPVCTYEGMQQRLRESYLEMSDLNDATCAPAGVAWKRVRNLFPALELYQADESHPSMFGTYLVACTFYSTIYQKESNGSMYLPTGFTTAQALTLQNAASRVVMDSLENWQQFGSLPKAKFAKTNIFNQFSFTNQSLRATQYSWNFGDGSPLSTQTNPIHTYNTAGNYIVSLTASNACGKWVVATDTAKVGSVLSVNELPTNQPGASLHVQGGNIQISQPELVDHLTVLDVSGRLIFSKPVTPLSAAYPLPNLQAGIYLYTLSKQGEVVTKGKFSLQ